MNLVKKPSFIVDLSSSMIVSSGTSFSEKTSQKLYCKCGNNQTFNSKVVRNIIKNYDELTEDSESLKSVTCDSCGTVYDKLEKIYLLEPNVDEIYQVKYDFKNRQSSFDVLKNVFLIEKTKYIANYNSNKESLIFSEVTDVLEIYVNQKRCKINMTAPFEKSESIYDSKIDADKLGKRISENIDITNVKFLEEFFSYTDSINYIGFNELSSSMEELKPYVKDLEKFDSVYFIDFIKTKNKILFDKDKNNNITYFQEVNSGFGDGQYIKKKLNLGDYLFNTMNSYKLLISMITFDNASCIIHTKGYNFFKNWIESNFILKPSVYKNHKATNPNSIIEVSMHYNKEGSERVPNVNNRASLSEKKIFVGKKLKISSTIYNSIKLISNLETLNECNYLNYLSKENIEFLMQNYEPNRVYGVISKVNKSRHTNDSVVMNFKNIKHTLDCNMDLKSTDFINIYKDTIRVIDLLDLKEKVIFKCKTYSQLKELHDDYTARYNAMKDAKKAEFYAKSVVNFKLLNCQMADIKFEVVDTAERLNLEGLQMHHCIYTYLNRICDKEYLAINVTHVITNERATAGFVRKGNDLYLEQLKGYYNSRATGEMIEATFAFCKENKISIKQSFSSDMTVDKNRQRMMPGQMSEEELFEIRKKDFKNSDDSKEILNNNNADDSKEILNNNNEGVVTNFIKKIFK